MMRAINWRKPGEYRRQGTASADVTSVLLAACRARKVGISVFPVKADGTKQPALSRWKHWQQELAPLNQLHAWFTFQNAYGLAVVGGRVSQNLEILDFDREDIFDRYEIAARAQGLGELLDRIKAGYYELTPRPGVHLLYRCDAVAGNTKLAMTYDRDADGKIKRTEKGKLLEKTLIETKAEGGYAIVAPSNGKVHETGRPYVLILGGFESVTVITPEEREVLFALARTFSECLVEETAHPREQAHSDHAGGRPGDDFNARATWEQILEPHGWRIDHVNNGETYWTRPGKDRDTSATTNYKGSDLLYVFSTSTDFEPERGYSKFSAYALLEHDNDFGKAAQALMRLGYGTSGNSRRADRCEDAPDADFSDVAEAKPVSTISESWDSHGDEEENARTTAQERPRDNEEQPEPYPCPALLWRGVFRQVAERIGQRTWEVWIAILVALAARVNRTLYFQYHRPLYGMVYALLIKSTGMGKGLASDICRALMPVEYTIRDAVQSGPGLAPILAEIERGPKGKVLSVTPRPALLLMEEFTTLLKNAHIQHSTLFDTLNNLFHRSTPWNVSRSDRPNSGGGDMEIEDPTLTILATTTASLLKEHVGERLIHSGFLNRYLVLPGSTRTWKFYDPDAAGVDTRQVCGLLDDLPARAFGLGTPVWQVYTDDARERLVQWGEQTFAPIMNSAETEAESVKRLHMYAHVIALLYAWSEQAPRATLAHVECSMAVIETARDFLQALIREGVEPEVPKFKSYEIGLEQKIVAKVAAAAEKGIGRREVVRSIAGQKATSADVSTMIQKLLANYVLIEREGERHKGTGKGNHPPRLLYLPERDPTRRR